MRRPRLPPLSRVRRPELSVLVVAHDIRRELARTLISLAPGHQRHMEAADFEVIVVDNGSAPPLELDATSAANVRLVRMQEAPASPAAAINRGLREARGTVVAVMVDGARIASPGLLHFGRCATKLYDHAVVASLGYYLGFDLERFARGAGFDAAAEDALLEQIGWPAEPQRLFEIATLDDSSTDGWFPPISESNCLFLTRESWEALGGAEEAFSSPGGGLLNLDLLRRALDLPSAELVVLLGEGTFHQQHGGAATGLAPGAFAGHWEAWAAEYEAIRGEPYTTPFPTRPPTYLGTLPEPVLARLTWGVRHPALNRPAPLGPGFDFGLNASQATVAPADPAVAALVELAERELRAEHLTGALAVARLARARAPEEPEPQRIAQLLPSWIPFGEPAMEHRIEHHLALGEAHRLLGEREAAVAELQTALALDPDLQPAHVALSLLNLPGEMYLRWIERIYEFLAPEAILEIGVAKGLSLAAARPPTLAIGVDPAPSATVPLQAHSLLFPETSDEFFAARRLEHVLGGRSLGVVFIDGLHLYEQALRDFVNAEPHLDERSLVMIHDTLPLDEPTQRRARDTQFHTGDVWKLVLCLRRFRPELEVVTIATPWTGLTLVSGFGTGAGAEFAVRYEEAVAELIDLPFAELVSSRWHELGVIANDWETVRPRIKPLRRRSGGVGSRAD